MPLVYVLMATSSRLTIDGRDAEVWVVEVPAGLREKSGHQAVLHAVRNKFYPV